MRRRDREIADRGEMPRILRGEMLSARRSARRRAACRLNTLQSDGRREAQPRMPERLRREKYETGENHATKGRL